VMGLEPAHGPSRKYSAGHVALRPERDGTIVGYSGIDEMQRRYGDAIFATHFPGEGSSTGPVEAGFKANAWVRMRHTDFDDLRQMRSLVGEKVKCVAR